MIDALGFVAAALTSMAFLPQVIKTLRTKSVEDLSIVTLVAQTTGVAIWIVYGLRVSSKPVIVSNAITLALMLVLVLLKLRYRTYP